VADRGARAAARSDAACWGADESKRVVDILNSDSSGFRTVCPRPPQESMTEQCMNRIYCIITVFTAAVLLLLPQTAGAQKNIRVALALSKDVPGSNFINGMYEVFKSDVETRTNSALTIEIVYGGALGNPIGRMNEMRKGVIQMSDASDGNYATIYPDIQVLNIPYLFATEQKAWKVLDGPFGQKLAEDLRTKIGIRVLGWWESGGFKHFSSNKALRSPADFVGLKIRALGPLSVPLIEALKASAVPIAPKPPFITFNSILEQGRKVLA
jgi:TRAP-type C4-dicarboxylate transport system substrate-binding protein